MFSGRLKITVCGAKDLRTTKFMTRMQGVLSSIASSSSSADGGSLGSAGQGGSGAAGGDGGSASSAGDTNYALLDPYVALDVDELSIERTSTKSKTRDPTWNETFTTDLLRNANEAGFTVWHDATMPPDDFVANCKVQLADLIDKPDQPLHDLWVS